MTTPEDKHAALREAVEKATPGEWFRSGCRAKVGRADTHSVVATVDGKEIIIASVWYNPKTHDGFHDAVLMALANPAKIKELLSDHDALAEQVKGLTEARGEEFLEFKEALSDLRSLRQEHLDLTGGGPHWAERNKAAWARVDELFANEDEAAWVRQQEDAHG